MPIKILGRIRAENFSGHYSKAAENKRVIDIQMRLFKDGLIIDCNKNLNMFFDSIIFFHHVTPFVCLFTKYL